MLGCMGVMLGCMGVCSAGKAAAARHAQTNTEALEHISKSSQLVAALYIFELWLAGEQHAAAKSQTAQCQSDRASGTPTS